MLTFKLSTHFTFTPTEAIGPFICIFVLGFVHLFLTWLGIRGPPREHDFHIIMVQFFLNIKLQNNYFGIL